MRLVPVLAAVVLLLGSAVPALAETTILIPPGATLPADPAVLDAARARVAAGDTKGAIAGLAPYVAGHPDDAAAARLLGDLYFRVPDYAKAERVWKAILATRPSDKETHNRLGSLYAVQDRIDDSIAEFQRSLPSRAGYIGLIMGHKRAGDLAQFMAQAERLADEHPFDPEAWTDLGRFRYTMHQFDRAYEAFKHVVAIRPQACQNRVDVANALVDLQRVDEAIGHLEKCLQNDPAYYPAVVNLGEAYLEKNEIGKARPYLDRALVLRPGGSEALVDIGYVLDLQGDWRAAVGYYTRAIVADPLQPDGYINLGYDYNEHRLFGQAEAALIKGLSVSADDGRLHYMLAVAYNLQGKIPLAREQYRRAIESDQANVVRAARSELALLPAQ